MSFSWWRRLTQRRSKAATSRRQGHQSTSTRRFRPTLEGLEERELLDATILDPSFGTGGKVAVNYPNDVSRLNAVLWESGQILVAGTTQSNSGFLLARRNLDGRPDLNFGQFQRTPGYVLTSFGSGSTVATAVALQPDPSPNNPATLDI